MTDVIKILSEELNIKEEQVKNTVELLDEGNTLPFIARYRKEVTGGLDDTVLRTLEERLNYLRKLDERRGEVTALVEAQGKMTEELAAAIAAAATMTEIDDIYRPYRPKRKTRASVARERGLEPRALLICEQRTEYETPIAVAAEQFTCPENGIETAADAIAGACDIIAEDISDNAEYRKQIRSYTYD